MYGLVNQALEAMIKETAGPDVWGRISAKAGVDEPAFVAMKQYPDSVTYALAGAAASELGLPLDKALHAFGVYWVGYASRGPWGKLMQASGRNTYELLAALDEMHARIALSFPELRPPSFGVERVADGVLVEYRSDRPGLAPFVVGLIEGLGALYRERIEIRQVESRDAGAPHDRFHVRAFPIEGAD